MINHTLSVKTCPSSTINYMNFNDSPKLYIFQLPNEKGRIETYNESFVSNSKSIRKTDCRLLSQSVRQTRPHCNCEVLYF